MTNVNFPTKSLRTDNAAGDRGIPALSVKYQDVGELKLDPANPRLHSKRQIRQIAKSVQAFGFNVPVLVDGRGNVIAGHGRLLACADLGITRVPTICLDHLTPAQVRAFMIADNRLTENAEWNERLLAEQFKALSEVELDFTLEATGFEMGDMEQGEGRRCYLPSWAA